MSDINTRELRRLVREALLSEQERPGTLARGSQTATAAGAKAKTTMTSTSQDPNITNYERDLISQMSQILLNVASMEDVELTQKRQIITTKFIQLLKSIGLDNEQIATAFPQARQTVQESAVAMMDDEGKIHDDGHEVDMAESQLYRLAHYAPEVYGMVDNYADLPGWIQKKITLAADYIGSVKHYLEHEHFKAKNHLGDFKDGNDL